MGDDSKGGREIPQKQGGGGGGSSVGPRKPTTPPPRGLWPTASCQRYEPKEPMVAQLYKGTRSTTLST